MTSRLDGLATGTAVSSLELPTAVGDLFPVTSPGVILAERSSIGISTTATEGLPWRIPAAGSADVARSPLVVRYLLGLAIDELVLCLLPSVSSPILLLLPLVEMRFAGIVDRLVDDRTNGVRGVLDALLPPLDLVAEPRTNPVAPALGGLGFLGRSDSESDAVWPVEAAVVAVADADDGLDEPLFDADDLLLGVAMARPWVVAGA